jgi:hypothetical protein
MLHRLPWPPAKAAAAIALAAAVLTAPAARADFLRQEMAEAAKEIKNRLDDRGDKAVVINSFTGPKTKPATGGEELTLYLSEELKKLGVEIKPQAPVGIGGRFRDVTDKASGLLAAQITIQLFDKDEEPIGPPISRGVFGAAAIQSLFGTTGKLSVVSNPGEPILDVKRSEELKKEIDNPTVSIKDGRVAAPGDGKFAIQVLVGDDVREAKNEDGFAFVDIRHGESYGVKLINDNDYEIAVDLRIDGLSMFAFCDQRNDNGEPALETVIVGPHSDVVIRGWYITDKQSDKFTVTEYSKSAAASLGASTAQLGTITASYRACWDKANGAPPADEKDAHSEFGKDGDATGRGERFDANFTVVDRAFGVNRGSVSVRYTRNLK